MQFKDWQLIKESLTVGKLKSLGDAVKKNLSKSFGNLYMIPDFDTFDRENEPIQQTVLFTNKGITDDTDKTFSFNYTTRGDLYSVDFWKGLIPKPSVTLYVNHTPLSKVYILVPEIAKNPSTDLNLKKLISNISKNVLTEDINDDVDAELKDSEPYKELDPAVKKAEKRLEDEYDFSDPDTIFDDLKTYVDMVISGTQPSLLITGSPGVGKTYLVTKQLKESGTKYLHIKGRSTAAGMYITLYENNGKTIIFDDCDSIFSSDDAVNVLKGALDTDVPRTISWLVGKPLKTAEGKTVPKQFEFTGKVIFISNLPQKKIDKAIKSRSFVLEVALTPQNMLKKMRKELKFVSPEVPFFTKEHALDLIEDIAETAKNLELNMRTLVKAIKILDDVDNLAVAKRLITQQCSYK